MQIRRGARDEAARPGRGSSGLITQRSQVQILPPLLDEEPADLRIRSRSAGSLLSVTCGVVSLRTTLRASTLSASTGAASYRRRIGSATADAAWVHGPVPRASRAGSVRRSVETCQPQGRLRVT